MLDASGNEITDETHIGNLNPFRYRSYYYDTETELYFLQSRYYDPKIGRFITIDDHSYLDPDTINGINPYAYCLNNPLMFVDYTGCSVTAFLIGLGIMAIAGGIVGGVTAYNNSVDQGKTGADLFRSTVGGVFLGAGLGLAIGGAIVSLSAVGVGAFGITTLFGVSVGQLFAIGALAFNVAPFIIAPLFGIEMEGLEYPAP